jgi:hypothetical protein
MKVKLLTLAALSLAGVSANANGWDLEVGVENQRFNDSSGDFSFTALAVTAGYRWDFDADTSATFEASFAFGLGDDRFTVIIADINPFASLGYRFTQQLNNNWSVYGRAAYASTGLDISIESVGEDSFDENANGLGFGGGIAWRGVTAGYMLYTGDLEDYSAFSLGYRWRF